jgi:hypothetical protein
LAYPPLDVVEYGVGEIGVEAALPERLLNEV